MSGFKTIAVLGAFGGSSPISAGLGFKITQALLQTGVKVVAVGRKESGEKGSAKALKAAGASIALVDYDVPASIQDALQNVDVVVSGLSPIVAPAPQLAAIDAAKAAGVKLFLPSEFGNPRPDRVEKGNPFLGKQDAVDKLKGLGIPYTLIWTGLFAEFAPFVFTPPDNKVTLTGDGKAPISITAEKDVAAYVAYILTAVDPAKYQNKALGISSITASGNDIFELAKSKKPELTLQYEEPAAAQKRWEENPAAEFFSFLRVAWAAGKMNTGGADNGLAPGLKWTPITDYF